MGDNQMMDDFPCKELVSGAIDGFVASGLCIDRDTANLLASLPGRRLGWYNNGAALHGPWRPPSKGPIIAKCHACPSRWLGATIGLTSRIASEFDQLPQSALTRAHSNRWFLARFKSLLTSATMLIKSTRSRQALAIRRDE